MSTPVKVTLIIIAAVVLLAVTCVGGCFAFAIWAGTRPPPEGITVDLALPDTIVENQPFDFVVTITNSLPKERNLIDVDFWSPLLDGVAISAVNPPYESVSNVLVSTYTFNDPIPANDSVTITFSALPHTAGLYQGNLNVTVDSQFSVLETQQLINVQPAQP